MPIFPILICGSVGCRTESIVRARHEGPGEGWLVCIYEEEMGDGEMNL
jgi:hypothetical protein